MHLRRSNVKMEAISTSETSVVRNPTWCHNPSHMRIESVTYSSYHFVLYLSTPAQITCPKLWSVNNELEWDMKEGAVICLCYCHAETVEKHKIISAKIVCGPTKILIGHLPKYKSRAVTVSWPAQYSITTLHSASGKSLCTWATAESSWNVMAHGDAREGKFGKSLCT